MTHQEIFNRVATHLLRQGAKSMDGDICRYRGPNGLKCAVGCLIDDAHYTPDIEGIGVLDAPSLHEKLHDALEASGVPAGLETLRMLDALQAIHDSEPVFLWRSNLADLAKRYSLDASVAGGAVSKEKSPWCSWCLKLGQRRRAIRWANGKYDSYCREHKRERARLYMASRRLDDPSYGRGR